MKRNIAYRYRIYPNEAQEILLQKTFGCARFIWNQMLEEIKRSYEEEHKTKYEQLTQQTNVQCKISDYDISTLYAQLFHDFETSVRVVVVDGSALYFYRIYRKETKEQPAIEALVAYDDFVEIEGGGDELV